LFNMAALACADNSLAAESIELLNCVDWTTVCIFPSLSTYYSSGSKTCSRIGV